MQLIGYVVIFAAVCLFLLIIYDKRSLITDSIKKALQQKKPSKPPVIKQTADVTKKQDTDKEIKQENLSYGSFKMQDDSSVENQTKTQDDSYYGDTIFTPLITESEDDFNIEEMLKEIEDEKREEVSRRYESDNLDPRELPDFDSMTLSELNSILEDDMGSNISSFGNVSNSIDGLNGEELGEYIKNLPRAIKVIIATDILKRKF